MYRPVLAVLCATLLLPGCADGDRRAGMPDPDAAVGIEDDERRDRLAAGYRAHATFGRQWGLGRIGADQAYARLAIQHGEDVRPGAGVTVGLLDTGIDRDHPAFADTRIDEVFLPGAADETGHFPSHGTAVASVIAAGRGSSLPDAAHGVAWGANVVMFADAGFSDEPELPPEIEELPTEYFPVWSEALEEFDGEIAARLDTVLGWRDGERRVDFLNLSVGSHGLIDGYTETELRNVYRRSIAAMAQADADEKTILVWAAGNEHGLRCLPNQPYCLRGGVVAASPSYEAGLAARIAELRGHTVAVVAVAEEGGIAEYSNRCGLASEWCIAAPGDNVSLAYFGPDEETGEPGKRATWMAGGTSFAAPMVAGGLAVMKHRFRGQLSNEDLLARLLETADRTGRYAEEKIYGRGLMDLAAATAPVGGQRVATGTRVTGPGRTLWSTRLGLGGAVGDSLERSLAGREFVVFDSLGAPFWHRLGDRMTRPTRSPARSRLHELLSEESTGAEAGGRQSRYEEGLGPPRWETGFLAAPAGMSAGHLGLAGNAPALRYAGDGDLTLNAFSTVGMERRLPVAGAALAWHGGPVGLRGGWLAERESALGTRAEGAFGRLAANGVFAGIEGETNLEGWRMSGVAELGLTRPSPQGGLIEHVSPVATSALALHAERAAGEDRTILFSISQPLRVEAGRASLSVPVGRTRDGEVVNERVESSLVPSGRQLDLSAQWRQRLQVGGALRAGARFRIEPGHRSGGAPVLDLVAGYRNEF